MLFGGYPPLLWAGYRHISAAPKCKDRGASTHVATNPCIARHHNRAWRNECA